MPRIVHCVRLKREAEGLDLPPYPGKLGQRIYEQVSKEAWLAWLEHQKRLINETRLNLAESQARRSWPSKWSATSSALTHSARLDRSLRSGALSHAAHACAPRDGTGCGTDCAALAVVRVSAAG